MLGLVKLGLDLFCKIDWLGSIAKVVRQETYKEEKTQRAPLCLIGKVT